MGLGGGAASSLRGKENKRIEPRHLNRISSAPDKHSLGGVEVKVATPRSDEKTQRRDGKPPPPPCLSADPSEQGTWRSLEKPGETWRVWREG